MDRIFVPLASLLVGIFTFAQWAWLPETVASQFDASGRVTGFMPRGVFVAMMVLVSSGVPLLVWWSTVLDTRSGRIKVPNADHWLAAPRREATIAFLRSHAAVFSVVTCVFMGYVAWLVTAANLSPATDARLAIGHLIVALGAFLAFTTGWVIVLLVRFGRRR